MLRPLALLSLLVTPALACAVSASTSTQAGTSAEPGSGPGKPARAVNPGGPQASGDPGGDASPGAGPAASAPKACEVALADSSSSLFGGRVLIRLPKGVELVEQNPFYAHAAAPQQTTSCGAPVRFASVGYFAWPAGASLQQVRDQLLELRGVGLDALTWAEEGSRGRHFTGAYSVAADAKTQAPAVRGWLVLRDAPGDKFAYYAMFETDEAAWDGLRPAFQASGRELLVKPRAIQGPEQVAAPTKTEEPPPDPPKGKKKPKAAAK